MLTWQVGQFYSLITHPSGSISHADSHQRQDRSDDIEREERKPSVNERLKDVLNKPRERREPDNDREQERDDNENENTRDRDRGEGHSL